MEFIAFTTYKFYGVYTTWTAKKHFTCDIFIQKQACMALRNLVARTREHCASILECGAEDLLNYAGSYHKDCVDESKAALRDLGCAVHLKELWTGQKGSLEQ